MTPPEFTVPEINILLGLLHLRKPAKHADFEVHFKIKSFNPTERLKLEENGLITVHTEVGQRGLVYTLTDAGREAAFSIMAGARPRNPTGRMARVLWAVMGDLEVHLRRTDTDLAEVFRRDDAPPSTASASFDDPNAAILRAYHEWVAAPGDYFPLLKLRQCLKHFSRTVVDAALTDLVDKREIVLSSEADQKTLTKADREAALWLGGRNKHKMFVEVT